MKHTYLDNNATTAMRAQVAEAMLPYFTTAYGNASSIHWFGQQAKAAIDDARGRVAQLIGARVTEIVFTSGGTEADNFAIRGIAASQSAGDVILSRRVSSTMRSSTH